MPNDIINFGNLVSMPLAITKGTAISPEFIRALNINFSYVPSTHVPVMSIVHHSPSPLDIKVTLSPEAGDAGD